MQRSLFPTYSGFAPYAAALLVLLAATSSQARDALQVSAVTYKIAGLKKPAEILVDQWGVPH